MTKVSVVIPVYNGERYLSQALDSVLSQDYSEFEVIIVDDGSTDATKSIIARYNDSRIKYFYKLNGGPSSARNYGIERASGEYIAFLDADDIWDSEKLQRQVAFLESHKEMGVVGCDFQYINDNAEKTEVFNMRRLYPRDGFNLPNLLVHSFLLPSSVLIRKTAVDDAGFFNSQFDGAEDPDFFLRVLSKHDLGIIDEVLLKYRVGHISFSSGFHAYDVREKVLDRFFQVYLEDPRFDLEDARGRAYYNLYIQYGKGLLWTGRTKDSRKYFRKAFGNRRSIEAAWLYLKSCLKGVLMSLGFFKNAS